MRDFLLSESLKRLTTEAATRLSTLVAEGDEIPFDVAAEADDSGFFSYVPLTGTYVIAHAEELCALPGFGPAREAVVEAGVAAGYLELRGEVVPADPGARAELLLTSFLAELWEGSSGFALDRARLEEAIALLDAESRDADDADVLVVPLVGLRMSTQRLQLPHGVRLVRADSIEAPVEAMRSEGMGRAAWEPQFLAVAEQDPDGGADSALRQLQELVSVMRLFKGGGVGLGPYAFAPTGEDTWRRITTGAPATRPGGYRLSDEEAAELAEFATELESRPDPDAALSWAVGRFEMGCERESSLDGLSDHLLALRAVLEGHGPVGASLPMRAAALIADGSMDRIEARERVEEALELERELMNGRSLTNALELAAWTEEGVRRLLRQAALGELGGDLIGAADETLIATGLAEGDAEITVSVAAPVEEEEPEPRFAEEPAGEEAPLSEAIEPPSFDAPIEVTEASSEMEMPNFELPPDVEDYEEVEEREMPDETRIMEPIPAEDEIKITATPWLDEVSEARRGESLEWPAPPYDSDRDIQHRERIDTPRVRHLFPVPDSDWDVPHLEFDYDRKR
ncbi:MAG: hypothetical protein AB7V58_14225 [Solirubrobacterales bacterium]